MRNLTTIIVPNNRVAKNIGLKISSEIENGNDNDIVMIYSVDQYVASRVSTPPRQKEPLRLTNAW